MRQTQNVARYVVLFACLFLSVSARADYEKGMAAFKVKEYKVAVEEFRQSAEQGDARSQNALGIMHLNGQGITPNAEEGAVWIRKVAEQGLADAQERLGTLYSGGTGVPKDEKKAAEWVRKAAAQNNALAQAKLAVMYSRGWGLEKDEKQAAEWFLKAADQGNVEAQHRIAIMYGAGIGVPNDEIEALKWLRIAGVGGDRRSATIGEATAKRMTAEQVAESDRRAKAWLVEFLARKPNQ